MPDQAHTYPQAITVAQARAIDQWCELVWGLSTLVLMEHAATALVAQALALHGPGASARPHVLIVCGPGNNGGDGMAAARLLAARAVTSSVMLVGDPGLLAGDARRQWHLLGPLGDFVSITAVRDEREVETAIGVAKAVAARKPLVVIDALFGTGLTRAPNGAAAEAIAEINALHDVGTPVISADIPSGLDATTGLPLGAVVCATTTVTFIAPKPGLLVASAARFVGTLVVDDLGVPAGLIRRAVAAPHPAT